MGFRKFLMTSFIVLGSAAVAGPVIAQGAPAEVTPVVVSTVSYKQFTDKVEALGTLKANESVDLTATVTEHVTKILFEDGQRVKKGDVLVEMDSSEEQAELQEQKSFLAEAERQVNRLEPLVKKGAASASNLDTLRRESLAAEARIEAIQSRIDKRIIRAPYDGVLGLRNISVGALAQPGTVITTIDDDSVMKLDFSVPEVFISTLKPGIEIQARTKAFPNEVFAGHISSVDSRIDPVTRSIVARALIENPEGHLKPGLLMTVNVAKDPRKALVLSEEALIPQGANNFVLVIDKQGDKVTSVRRQVELGSRQFGIVEVISGVSAGEQVVTHGTLRVRPGAELEITAVEDEDTPLNKMLRAKGTK